MHFNKKAEPVYSSDTWYDLFDGGYIKPEELLTNKKEIEEVQDAIDTLQRFMSEAEDEGLIEVG